MKKIIDLVSNIFDILLYFEWGFRHFFTK